MGIIENRRLEVGLTHSVRVVSVFLVSAATMATACGPAGSSEADKANVTAASVEPRSAASGDFLIQPWGSRACVLAGCPTKSDPRGNVDEALNDPSNPPPSPILTVTLRTAVTASCSTGETDLCETEQPMYTTGDWPLTGALCESLPACD